MAKVELMTDCGVTWPGNSIKASKCHFNIAIIVQLSTQVSYRVLLLSEGLSWST